MNKLLEKLLQIDEVIGGEQGFISPSGQKITDISHEEYAVKYLKKHKVLVPHSATERVSKFMDLTKYVRYILLDGEQIQELDLTIVTFVSFAQADVIRAMSRKKGVVYDITDNQGDTIEYGTGLSNLMSSLKRLNYLK